MNTPRRPRGSSPLKQAFALLVGVVYAFATLSVFIHISEIRHAVCEEHGELIHVSVNDRPAAVTDGSAAVIARGAKDVHDHCGLDLHAVADVPSDPPPVLSAGLPVELEGTSVAPRDPLWVAETRYLVAPKQSPPVV